MRAIVLLLAAALCCGSVRAAVPQLLSYQGRLTASAGTPVNGTVQMTFRLYDAATTGNLKWSEIQQAVVVDNGIFDVVLGSVTGLPPLPFDVPYWLTVAINADGEMSPRQRVAASAYAIRAASAEALAATATVAGTQIAGALGNATLPAANLTGAVGLYAFSTGNAAIGAGTYFAGQGTATSVGSLLPINFPDTSPTVLAKFDSASLLVPASGHAVSFSACLKGAAPGAIYDVYLMAKDVAQTQVYLLGLNPVLLTTAAPCGALTLNAPLNAFQTLAPWIQSISSGANYGIAITVTFAGN